MSKIVFVGLVNAPETFEIEASTKVVVYRGYAYGASTGMTADCIDALIAKLDEGGAFDLHVVRADEVGMGQSVMVANDQPDGSWWGACRAWRVDVIREDDGMAKVGIEIDEHLAPGVFDPAGGYDRDPALANWPTDEQIEAAIGEQLGGRWRLLSDADMGDSLQECIRWAVTR